MSRVRLPGAAGVRTAVAVALLVALALATNGHYLLKVVRFRAAYEWPNLTTYYENRFAALRRLLPRHGVVGYVSDRPDSDREYFLTQYALAPVLLDRGGLHAVVVGNFFDPATALAIAAPMRLVLVRDLGDGVMLFRGPGM